MSAVLAPEDRPYLVAAAWLHDVGYAPPLNKIGFHPVDGARYVRQRGQEWLASLVAYHSGARCEAEERGLVDALAEFEPEDGPLLDALTYADMTTGPAGQRVVLEERIAEILERYPPDDPAARQRNGQRPSAGRGDELARIRRIIAALLRKAAATSSPHEAAACRRRPTPCAPSPASSG